MEKEPITIKGLEQLKKELIFLKEKKRPKIASKKHPKQCPTKRSKKRPKARPKKSGLKKRPKTHPKNVICQKVFCLHQTT